jgi:hypothetical protein
MVKVMGENAGRENMRIVAPLIALNLCSCASQASWRMLKRIAIAAGFLLAAVAGADAMNFTLVGDRSTVHASGPIEEGDAAKFAALPKFDTLELDSPGGLVGEALAMAATWTRAAVTGLL